MRSSCVDGSYIADRGNGGKYSTPVVPTVPLFREFLVDAAAACSDEVFIPGMNMYPNGVGNVGLPAAAAAAEDHCAALEAVGNTYGFLDMTAAATAAGVLEWRRLDAEEMEGAAKERGVNLATYILVMISLSI